MLTRKRHLSAFPFKRLFSNHLNRDTEAHTQDSITSTILAQRYGVVLTEKHAISISLCIRNKSAKKLNRSGPKIEPCGPPTVTASHYKRIQTGSINSRI